MRHRLYFLLLLVFCSSGTLGQVNNFGRNLVNVLASDSFKGRGYVDGGHKKAAKLISDEFARLGLAAADGNSFYQNFQCTVSVVSEPLYLKINRKTLRPGIDYLVDPSSKSEIAKRRITTATYQSDMVIRYSKVLGKKRAVLIDFQGGNTRERYAYLNDLRSSTLPESPLLVKMPNTAWRISKTNTDKVLFYLEPECLPKKVKKVRYSVNTESKPFQTQNVIGLWKGKRVPDSTIVICGHYDHLGMMGEEAIFNGANDNASGIAIILNVLRNLKAQDFSPDYSIAFIAFGAEEAGLLGSRYFVEHPLFDLSKTRFVLNLDLMGTGGAGITVVNAPGHSTEFELLKRLNEEKPQLLSVNSRKNTQNSDHYPFTQKGVPAFFVYAMGAWSNYHDVFDRPEELPLGRFNDLSLLFENFLKELDGSSTSEH